MKEAPSLLQLIPDIFFDALAYILPASLLFIGVMTIPSSVGSPLVNSYLNLGASFDRFIVVLFGIGLLYIVGQLLTHFSYDLILRPLRKLAEWRKVKEFAGSDIEWMADYTFIRHKDAALGVGDQQEICTHNYVAEQCFGSPVADDHLPAQRPMDRVNRQRDSLSTFCP